MAGEQFLYNRPLPGARLNMAHPLSKGLVGCWLFNENGGMRAMDLSPYGNHGLLTGFSDPPKRPFNGLSFDGVNDLVSVPAHALLKAGANNFSLAMWFKRNNASPGCDLVGTRNSAAAAEGWLLTFDFASDVLLTYISSDGLGWDIAVGGFSEVIPNNTWTFLEMKRDGPTITLYQNHIANSNPVNVGATAISDTAAGLNIGASGDQTRATICDIGAIFLYFKKALTGIESLSLYNNPYRPMGLPLFI